MTVESHIEHFEGYRIVIRVSVGSCKLRSLEGPSRLCYFSYLCSLKNFSYLLCSEVAMATERKMGSVIAGEKFDPSTLRTNQVETDYLYAALWHACAGPLVALPRVGDKVFYYLQGHLEQVEASTNNGGVLEIPVYDIPSVILCTVVHIQLKAEVDTDEVFAQVTLVPETEQEARNLDTVVNPLPVKTNVYSFCKILTASDASIYGGFSVPKRHAEECLPPLDMSRQIPSQDLATKDLHGVGWHFRHIYRGQPKRHLFTCGWSTFVSSKRLVAGDTFIFIRGENGELRVGFRRANKSEYIVSASVMSGHGMQLGVLATASHAISTKTMFTVYYRPRTSPSEFIIPYDQYMDSTKIPYSVGMRFRMKFEAEDSLEKLEGTIVGIGDVDHVRWPGSKWRCLMVQWDYTCTSVVHPDRVSPWNIEPLEVTSPTLPIVPLSKRTHTCSSSPESSSVLGDVSFRSGSPPGLGLNGYSFPRFSSCWTGGSVGISRNPSVARFRSQSSGFRKWKTHELKQVTRPVTQSKGSSTCMIFGVDLSSGTEPSTSGISESSNSKDIKLSASSGSGSNEKQCQSCCITSQTCTKVHKYGTALGRSVDLTRFKVIDFFKSLIKFLIFEGKLIDPSYNWRAIYKDKEEDVMLLGDHPWGSVIPWCEKCSSTLRKKSISSVLAHQICCPCKCSP